MVNFRIDVVVDPKRAKIGTNAVQKQLVKTQTRADSLRKSLVRAVGVLGGTAIIFRSIRSLATFEESLATLRAITGATADQFADLREEASRLGLETRFTASQAADAMVNLSRAGFSVTESLASVSDTLNLAVAGNLDLAQSADITASALRGFRISADEAGRVTDVLTLAANSANTTLFQLGDGIKFVAPVAAGLGQSIELTTAALGTLSDAGLKANMAGTGLRRVLAELESPTSASEKVLRALGVTTEEVQVSSVGLVNALQRLSDAGITTGESLQIFGQRGGPAFEVLVNNIPRIEKLNDALENSQGVAKKTADEIDQSLLGSLRRVQSAFEGTIIAAGEAGGTSVLTTTFEGLAQSLRILAGEIDVVGSTLTQLLAIFATAKIGAFAISIAKSAQAVGGLTVALNAARTSALSAKASFGILAVALIGVNKILSYQRDIIDDINQSYKNLEADAQFGKLGRVIEHANDELKTLRKAIDAQQERGYGPSKSQLDQIAQLEERIRRARTEIRKEADDRKKVNDARNASLPTLDNLIAKLDREAAVLRDLTRETKVQMRAEEEIRALRAAGQTGIMDADRKAIESRLRQIESLRDQKVLLEEIKGPQQDLMRQQDALNGLLQRGAITTQEFRDKLAELKGEMDVVPGSGAPTDPYSEQVQGLRALNEELRIRAENQGIQEQGLLIELDLARQGIEVTSEQRRQIADLLFARQSLTEEINKQKAAEEGLFELAKRNERSVGRMVQQVEATKQLSAQQDILNRKFQAGSIDLETYTQITEDLRLKSLEASTALGDGFTRAFIKIKQEAEDLASVSEKVVGVFADQATDAIVTFAETGKFAFKDFASAILKDLLRIITRLLVVQALNAAFGGGGGGGLGNAAAGSLSGTRQEGGTVQPGRSYLVGENGPEIFHPEQTGSVEPNPQDQPAAKPEVKVQVVNVQDPDEIPQTISSGRADDSIINALARNKDKVKQVIQ